MTAALLPAWAQDPSDPPPPLPDRPPELDPIAGNVSKPSVTASALEAAEQFRAVTPWQLRRRFVELAHGAQREWTTRKGIRACGSPLFAPGLKNPGTSLEEWAWCDGKKTWAEEGQGGTYPAVDVQRGILPPRVRGGPYEPHARFVGLSSCGSRYCWRCGPKILALRGELLAIASRLHQERGGALLFMTLTQPHDAHHDLVELLRVQAEVWRMLQQGRWALWFRETFGVVGYYNGADLTHGANGFHPHRHILWFMRRELQEDEWRKMQCALFELWNAGLEAAGYQGPDWAFCKLEVPRHDRDVARYCASAVGLALRQGQALPKETAQNVGKHAAAGHRSIGQIWQDACVYLEKPAPEDPPELHTDYTRALAKRDRAIELAQEIERAYRRRRSWSASKGVQELLHEAAELLELSDVEYQHALSLPRWAYRVMRDSRILSLVLELVERDGAGLRAFDDALYQIWSKSEVSRYSRLAKDGQFFSERRYAPPLETQRCLMVQALRAALVTDERPIPAQLRAIQLTREEAEFTMSWWRRHKDAIELV